MHLGVRVEHLEDAAGGGDRLLQVGVDAAQLLGRPVGQEQRRDERREVARRQPALRDLRGCRTRAPPAIAMPPRNSITGGSDESALVTFMLVR